MSLPALVLALLLLSANAREAAALRDEPAILRRACPDYLSYSTTPHPPYSGGPLNLPYQRPAIECRTFNSSAVEQVIEDVTSRMVDKDLAQLFRNAFPNTLDTTIRWHTDGSTTAIRQSKSKKQNEQWTGPQTFVVTGDINAEWLRDSTNQLANYQTLANRDRRLYNLIQGAINTQAEFVIQSPYCNAFQPPPPSNIPPEAHNQDDQVHPAYEPSVVFECKYELDSLANFLALATDFYENTGSTDFLTSRWYTALDTLLAVLDAQSQPTFNTEGQFVTNQYTFQRSTTLGTETLSLAGVGNPLNSGTGLIRSAFRPSDDATIMGFFIPANAQMAVQLNKTAAMLRAAGGHDVLASNLHDRSARLCRAIQEHAIVNHPKFGDVYAFEVDGYGSHVFMDDANVPSLLSLPVLGYLDIDDPVYKNTRKMILSKDGNPYYLTGSAFHGIGGPHIGLENAWPMSLLIQAQTSDSDTEIRECLSLVKNSSLLGLVHESINVNNIVEYTRPWFAWANSVFAQTVLKIAAERPAIVFGEGAEPYVP
ncbi:glycoside hydrolase family 125 protein [Aspergillus foveolatus]|uniref:glycoside hydrolase family 125 protein n=1 Tax=Aspergillus foveolatus TaxID=210207 RepID=UPI003CCD9DE7